MGAVEKTVFEFRGFRLDSATLEHAGARVPLSPKAVDLLFLLASRAPAIVTKEEIFEAVWPGTFVVESSLARNVSVIRKALEERAPGPFIETIPKRGYRFVAPLDEPAAEPLAESAAPPATPPIVAVISVPSPPVSNRKTVAAVAGLALLAAATGFWFLRQRSAAPQQEEGAAERIGRHLLSKGTPAEAGKALQYFEQAIRERPNSAGAHAGLAETLALLPGLASGGLPELRRARGEAELALRLDPRHPSALTALGVVQLLFDWDFAAAERSLQRALGFDSRCVNAYFGYGLLLSWMGRSGEARALMDKARQVDPVSPLLGSLSGRLRYEDGQFEQAAAELRAVLEREPHYTLAHYYLGLSYAFLERFQDADRHLAAAELHPGVLRTDRAWVRLRQGDPGPAREVYAELRRLTAEGKYEPPAPLLLAVALGDLDQAFASLDGAVRARSVMALSAAVDPRLAPLRGDPRFRKLIEKSGLPLKR